MTRQSRNVGTSQTWNAQTWHFCNPGVLAKLAVELSSRTKPYMMGFYLSDLAEVAAQVLHSTPLVITDKKRFDRVRVELRGLELKYLTPSLLVLDRLNRGYSYPLEYRST